MHEILHSIGFYHEFTRPDRDRYISIRKEKVQQGKAVLYSVEPI